MSEDNPKNISEVERIKWLISRIDLYHKLSLDSLDYALKLFSDVEEKVSKGINSWKKTVFTILGLVLPLTFGINTIEPIPIGIVYWILAIVSSLALLTYLIFIWIENFAGYSYSLLIKITNDCKICVIESQTSVAVRLGDLGMIDIKPVKNYGVFALLLRIVIAVYLMKELKRKESIKTKWVLDELKEEFEKIKKLTEDVPRLYNQLDTSETLPESSFELIKNNLEQYKKIQK